jgi:large subunit ribosomal protein L35Ae
VELKEEYSGVALNYRLGKKRQRPRECLIVVREVEEDIPMRLIGWKVSWPQDRSRLFGRISKPHGKSGTLLVKFDRGLPGQALGTPVKITK